MLYRGYNGLYRGYNEARGPGGACAVTLPQAPFPYFYKHGALGANGYTRSVTVPEENETM